MLDPAVKASYSEQVIFVRDQECIVLINRISALIGREPEDVEIVRLMAIPMIYSVWERCFSVWISVCLRLARDASQRALDCPPGVRAFWLRKASFFKSFVDLVRGVLELDREDFVHAQASGLSKKIKKGGFTLSAEFLKQLDEWHSSPLSGIDPRELVVTFSNVNDAVVGLNSDALGLSAFPEFSEVDLSQLGQLVAMRNGIGHGANLQPPGSLQTKELLEYTERLILGFSKVVLRWIEDYPDAPSSLTE